MFSEALVQLALGTKSCSQKELAVSLGVSPTQISKWKKGDHMSKDMEERFRMMVNIGGKNPQFVVWAGSLESANKWEKLIKYLAELAECGEETGYDTEPFHDDLEVLCWKTFDTLRKMGVQLPIAFPESLNFDSYDSEALDDAIEDNTYSRLIHKIFSSLTNVYGFHSAYVAALIYDSELDLDEVGGNIDSCLMDLAATKLEKDDINDLAPNFIEFQKSVKSDYAKWLSIVKERAFRASVPLQTELLCMVYDSDESLGQEAESKWLTSLGLKSPPLHPDIYMNELLVGIRAIHQVLPVIIKKLGIEYEVNLEK